MKVMADRSGEFASLLEKLQRFPKDVLLKQAILDYLPQIKALAKTCPMTLFRLAKLYPNTSSHYQGMIERSAAMGCTNAMLAACVFYLKSNVSKSMDYLRRIEASNDSYIKKLAADLVANTPSLKQALRRVRVKESNSLYSRFFVSSATSHAASKEQKSQEPNTEISFFREL